MGTTMRMGLITMKIRVEVVVSGIVVAVALVLLIILGTGIVIIRETAVPPIY